MFVRKKKNASGSVSIQVIAKHKGAYNVACSVGSSKDPDEIERLCEKADQMIPHLLNQTVLGLSFPEDKTIESFLSSVSNLDIRTIGPELIYGTLFDRLGFSAIKDDLFRYVTIARLVYPTSKLKTIDYLYRYQGVSINKDRIYRFLDTLNKDHKAQVERIAYDYTKKTLETISVVFYDMTTLYFEAEDEDDLRKIGFSKDGKFQCPQIMLGLLVGSGGLPIGYDIFEGNTFEGHTLLPTLDKIQEKYSFGKPIVVADAGLLSKKNIAKLVEQDYCFILGGRIKNESDGLKQQILENSENTKNGESVVIKKQDGTRLVVTYSDKRARKDAHNRDRGLKKLKAKVASGKLTKAYINNRGYNRFLTLKGEVAITVDEERVVEDKRWDGLKGYVTNTNLSPKEVVEHYGHLWQIERAFRISKTDLRIRPIYHYRKRRIEAHICIAFVSYTIYKELERLLDKHKTGISPRRAAELTHNMYEIHYRLPRSRTERTMLFSMSDEQEELRRVVEKG